MSEPAISLVNGADDMEMKGNAKCSINSAQTCGGNVDGMIYQSVYLVYVTLQR